MADCTEQKSHLKKIYLWTLSYFKPFWKMTLFYVMCGGAMIFGELMIPRRMGTLIDQLMPSKDLSRIGKEIIFLSGIVLGILIVKAIYQFLEVFISNKITQNQQMDLMKKLQQLGFSYYEKVPTGQILGMFENSVNETQKTYTFLFPNFIYCLAQFAVPSIILIQTAPMFFMASMIGNILYVGLNHFTNKNIHYYLGIETEAAQVSQQTLYDSLSATTELKAMGSQKWFAVKTLKAFDAFRIPRMWSIFWRHFRFTTVGLTLTISVVLFYVFGLDLIQSGELLLGEFIGLSFLMGLASRGFSVFFYIIPAQYHALNYAKHLYEFMHLKPEVSEGSHELSEGSCEQIESSYEQSEGVHEQNEWIGNTIKNDVPKVVLEFKSVSFGYQAERPILNQLNLAIEKGKKTAFVGESGSGKSTVLKLIGRFYDPVEGVIEWNGHDLKTLKFDTLRQELGYVFQETYLFNLSIKENIRFGNPAASDQDVIEAAKKACAHEFILEMENGYDTPVGERGMRLSGGQRQRIAIARMLLKNPSMILLDEATSALDNQTEQRVKEAIDALSDGKTVVAVAHRLSTIQDYDHIIVLDSGKVAEQGTYYSLMAQEGIFYHLMMRGDVHEK